MNPRDLKPNPLNEQIYGKESVDLDLVESIKKHGLLENLVIKQNGTIISGHRRWLAVLELHPKHIKNVACEIIGFPSGEEGQLLEEERLLESNRQRKKTDVQLANEGRLLEKIYTKQAEMRKLANLKQNNLSENKSTEGANLPSRKEDPRVNLPQGTKGKTTEKVAKDLDMSEGSYRKLKKLREASESNDTVIAQIADRLLKDSMSKNKKYNLFLNFMKIYHDCNSANPKISDYATGLVSDIYARFTKIEDAHLELSNYMKAVENKEKALKNEYPSDDCESESKEYIEDEEGIQEEKSKNINSILNAKPAESEKPKVSPKYQALLDKTNDENVFIADFARHQLKCVDNNELTTDDAYENVKGFIREEKQKEKARKDMMNVPEEPGEILEKESERPNSNSSKMERPKDQNNVDTPWDEIPSTSGEKSKKSSIHEQIKEAGIYCSNCVEKSQETMDAILKEDWDDEDLRQNLKIIIKRSMESAKNKHKWCMDDHLLLNDVLMELSSS